MNLKNRLPPQIVTFLGFGSIIVMILGLAFGYILFLLGLSLAFGHGIPADDLTTVESIIISGIGAVVIVIGYLGWRGFLRFSF